MAGQDSPESDQLVALGIDRISITADLQKLWSWLKHLAGGVWIHKPASDHSACIKEAWPVDQNEPS
ncbi:MAG: hypothetical protein A3E37_01120 [Candidatus Andersenbacteria bacterium RIFCSPHIGHO2_12_FULL_46_9]|nr:MAG: hypothetical protein A3E37_01120 [Candidatus Andersenbacteria bacterium RIFCSPHIGHO2_12_FULL_46_9]